MTPAPEKRRTPRQPLARPAKVYHHPTGRYLIARTCDVSAGGALLRVESARPLRPGDEVEVLIAWRDRVLLEAADQAPGRVTRVMPTGARSQLAAVEFETGLLAVPRAA
jgi:hypothetical protein